MASIQPHTHSFIVKVWLASPEGEMRDRTPDGLVIDAEHKPESKHQHSNRPDQGASQAFQAGVGRQPVHQAG